MVYNMFCSQFDNNLAPIPWTSNFYACLILRIQPWATKIDFFFYQIWCPEKVDNLQKFCSRRNKIFADMLIFLVFSKSGIHYLCQGEISACKVLIKGVPVKNDHYFLRIYQSRAHCPVNTNVNLIWSTYSKSNLAIKSPAILLLLILSV